MLRTGSDSTTISFHDPQLHHPADSYQTTIETHTCEADLSAMCLHRHGGSHRCAECEVLQEVGQWNDTVGPQRPSQSLTLKSNQDKQHSHEQAAAWLQQYKAIRRKESEWSTEAPREKSQSTGPPINPLVEHKKIMQVVLNEPGIRATNITRAYDSASVSPRTDARLVRTTTPSLLEPDIGREECSTAVAEGTWYFSSLHIIPQDSTTRTRDYICRSGPGTIIVLNIIADCFNNAGAVCKASAASTGFQVLHITLISAEEEDIHWSLSECNPDNHSQPDLAKITSIMIPDVEIWLLATLRSDLTVPSFQTAPRQSLRVDDGSRVTPQG
nr:hypothetical protein CFP56_04589 [Quercus suber]